MLRGIFPILITPFDENGQVDEAGLRRVVQFELGGGIQGLGVGGFASEAYKLSEAERRQCAEIVADEIGGKVPLIIGMSPGSTEVAIEQAKFYAQLKPAALMVLPPNTMKLEEQALIDHYVDLGNESAVPIMVQQSPQIMAYAGCQLSAAGLAEIARRCANVHYFKIEGTGSSERIKALSPLVNDQIAMFGGVGGIALRDELAAGAAGLLPGVGFNDYFVQIWAAWEAGNKAEVDVILQAAQPLVEAVSGKGHEFSLHARKFLLHRAGIIQCNYVRRPTVSPTSADLAILGTLVDKLQIRINR